MSERLHPKITPCDNCGRDTPNKCGICRDCRAEDKARYDRGDYVDGPFGFNDFDNLRDDSLGPVGSDDRP